ncbi:MAG: ATP-grasp domain-containing protein [Gammaproteobacteria bacterium]|nr:ATP-grasp domain-containing protein [Gammaproteobacteria bacterium]
MNNSIKKCDFIIIVGAYSSGAKLAKYFLEHGYKCIHVTSQKVWEIARLHKTFIAKDFYANYIIDDEHALDELICKLSKFNIKAVIAGSEPSVILADKIASYFDVYKNDLSKTMARRNKYFMIEEIRKAGLRAPAQLKTNCKHDAVSWLQRNGYKNVIIKPLASSSSDSVYKCSNKDEVSCAVDAIIGHTDLYNEVNNEALVQEYIDGAEYIVNSVSSRGKHYITDIWKGYSNTPNLISTDSYADLVRSCDDHYDAICEYTKKVLDAIGIINGSAHTELRVSSDGSPCIIEVGARLAGKANFDAINLVLGINQAQLTVESVNSPERFLNYFKRHNSNTSKCMRYVYLASHVEGMVKKNVSVEHILALDSLYSLHLQFDVGDYLFRTDKIRRKSRPGYAYLIADNQDKLELDYQTFKQYEAALYESVLLLD